MDEIEAASRPYLILESKLDSGSQHLAPVADSKNGIVTSGW
jgi:hypothetical protein